LVDSFNEALVQARIIEQHPNIVSFKGLYVSHEEDSITRKKVFTCAFVMEFCENTLEKYINERTKINPPFLQFTEDEVIDMITQTLTGLSYLANGISTLKTLLIIKFLKL
jgi:serine/threonine protein kinase